MFEDLNDETVELSSIRIASPISGIGATVYSQAFISAGCSFCCTGATEFELSEDKLRSEAIEIAFSNVSISSFLIYGFNKVAEAYIDFDIFSKQIIFVYSL
jgi:hypothetical protein